MSEYEKEASQFLSKNNIRFNAEYIGEEFPLWNLKKLHSVFRCKFYNHNSKKSMTVKFYQSLENKRQIPSSYDVLACLQKYEVSDNLEDFIKEFGYEINSVPDFLRVEKTFKAVKKEYTSVLRVFGDCLEELQEIN